MRYLKWYLLMNSQIDNIELNHKKNKILVDKKHNYIIITLLMSLYFENR